MHTVGSEKTDSVKQSRVKLQFFLDPKQDTDTVKKDELSLWLVELWMAEGQVGGRGRGWLSLRADVVWADGIMVSRRHERETTTEQTEQSGHEWQKSRGSYTMS